MGKLMEVDAVKCSITGCPGEYEHRLVVQSLRRDGQTVVVEDVPAEVCAICGDTLFSADTLRSVEKLLASQSKPALTVPSFTFPLSAASDEHAAN